MAIPSILVNSFWKVYHMNKEEILAKSRAENKNKDIYEQEILYYNSIKS